MISVNTQHLKTTYGFLHICVTNTVYLCFSRATEWEKDGNLCHGARPYGEQRRLVNLYLGFLNLFLFAVYIKKLRAVVFGLLNDNSMSTETEDQRNLFPTPKECFGN